MSQEDLTLASPSLALGDAFWALLDDYRAAGEIGHVPGSGAVDELATLAREALPDFIRRLDERSRSIGLPPGYVPDNAYWLVRCSDGAVVGVSSLRHRLTPALEDVGGHIGYSIRPSERRKGYGTSILALTMEKARALGLAQVLLTCDTDNLGSARIIEKNGGVLASSGFSARSGTHVSRYWIAL
jgi:predicted acetyltransferase